ncbi:MAG: helix-turn-helix transcriptional regulator [Actinomycetota bacterium]|nr:helix-turn-helix transcriptional regulator [Acidimicrobiia bacterium]MDQ3470418.1 helix-turn-helix transcriptional regulator [Actinomycetota bacterium]
MIAAGPVERGLPRAYLRAVLLVLVAAGPTHGYDLLEQVRQAGIRLADPGGLYRTLRAMEREQVLASWWENSSSGPPRRTYTLTSTGRAALAVQVGEMGEMIDLLSELVARADGVVDRAGR